MGSGVQSVAQALHHLVTRSFDSKMALLHVLARSAPADILNIPACQGSGTHTYTHTHTPLFSRSSLTRHLPKENCRRRGLLYFQDCPEGKLRGHAPVGTEQHHTLCDHTPFAPHAATSCQLIGPDIVLCIASDLACATSLRATPSVSVGPATSSVHIWNVCHSVIPRQLGRERRHNESADATWPCRHGVVTCKCTLVSELSNHVRMLEVLDRS